jgi:PAS domain S-box-containing protein
MSQVEINWPPPGSMIQDLPVAYTEIDAKGILRAANDAACRLHGMPAEELVGHTIWEFLAREDAARSRSDFFHIMESGEDPPVIRRSLYTASGEYRTHELHRRMLRDTDGTPVGVCCATFDVTESESAYRELKSAKGWLEGALSAIAQAVVVTDALGFVRYLNPSAERLTGWLSKELRGQQFEQGMPILRSVSKTNQPLSFRMTLLEPWHGDVELMTRERRTVAVWLSASPIVEPEEGYIQGVVIVLGSPKVAEAGKTAAG